MQPRKLFTLVVVNLTMTFSILCFLSVQRSYCQTNASKEVREKLQNIYNRIKKPEISFEKFLQMNSRAYDRKVLPSRDVNVNPAPQDTYCSKVRTYCKNGTFEEGLDTSQYTGAYGVWSGSLYPDPFSLTYGFSSGNLYDYSAHQTIVDTSMGKDPITNISLVPNYGGKKSLRLGNTDVYNGTELIAKTIKVDANETILNFYYAVVLQDPGHPHDAQPAFSVRAYDCATGDELSNVCDLGNKSNIVVSDANNPFFKSLNDPYYGLIAYRDWSRAQIDLSKYIGKKIIVIFTNKDCDYGAHFGYTYLDNLFSTKCPVGIDTSYNITLDSLKTDTCGKGSICTKYKLPTIDSSGTITTGSIKISLDIYQNSHLVKTINSSTLKKDSAYCFSIDPAALGINSSLGGFDYVFTGHFIINGFPLNDIIVGNPPTGQKAGTNNDYSITCPSTNIYYSKSSGDLHKVATWGVNRDGSGTNPTDFGVGKIFVLANRSGSYTMTGNWTVGGLIVDSSSNVLKINGFTLSEAGITGGGKLAGTDSSGLIVTGTAGGDAGKLNFTSSGGSLKNLTLNRTGDSASATVGSSLKIYGVLTVTNGTLYTGSKITLKSNAFNTARVAPVSGNISGSVTVERYIPARRAWRIMSAPVGGSQTINAAWQEGAASATSNPHPGYGTHITGGYKYGTAANGFDVHDSSKSSIKFYKSSNDTWDSVPNTNATAVNANAYLLFVRGDRSIILDGATTTPNNTVLRVKGPLKIGDQTFQVSKSGFTAIPNPYASPINFATITRNNVPNNFYLWDPKMIGLDSVGGYVLLSYDEQHGGYTMVPEPVSPESQYIQSGQGFLVHDSTGTGGSIVIKESDKSSTPATNVFRSINTEKGLRVNLKTINADETASVLDGVFTLYGNDFSDKIDGNNAPKPANMGENLAILSHGQNLMLERKAFEFTSDTIHLKMWNINQKNYFLEFNPVNLSSASLTATLVDNYLHTATPVSLTKMSQVFISNNSEASADRFMVIITSEKPLVSTNADNGKNAFECYPNPVSGKAINIKFNNQPAGIYHIEMINSMGQVIHSGQIKHVGGSATQVLQLGNKPVNGIYQIRVTRGNVKNTLPIVVN